MWSQWKLFFEDLNSDESSWSWWGWWWWRRCSWSRRGWCSCVESPWARTGVTWSHEELFIEDFISDECWWSPGAAFRESENWSQIKKQDNFEFSQFSIIDSLVIEFRLIAFQLVIDFCSKRTLFLKVWRFKKYNKNTVVWLLKSIK